MPASSPAVRYSFDEPRRSKRCRVETIFGPDFLTTFLIDDFNVNSLIDVLVFAFFIREDPKTYEEVMRFMDVSF